MRKIIFPSLYWHDSGIKARPVLPVWALVGALVWSLALALLGGCHGLITSTPVGERATELQKPAKATTTPAKRGGGYYQDDGN